jgi:hypothetical protein
MNRRKSRLNGDLYDEYIVMNDFSMREFDVELHEIRHILTQVRNEKIIIYINLYSDAPTKWLNRTCACDVCSYMDDEYNRCEFVRDDLPNMLKFIKIARRLMIRF